MEVAGAATSADPAGRIRHSDRLPPRPSQRLRARAVQPLQQARAAAASLASRDTGSDAFRVHSARSFQRRRGMTGPAFHLLAIALLLSSCAPRQGATTTRPVALAPGHRFPTAAAAADAAGHAAKLCEAGETALWQGSAGPFEGPEFGGRIWHLADGRYSYTTAPALPPARLAALNAEIRTHNRQHPSRPRGLAAGVCHPRSAPRGPAGSVEVALWHTHPGNASFSETDRLLSSRLGLPLYLTRDRIIGGGIVTECFPAPRGGRDAK